MPDYLQLTIGKFIFRVAVDRLYTQAGMWARLVENRIQIGLSDFLQQRSGDVAFAEIKEIGTQLAVDDEVAVIETIKVNLSLGSPVAGKIVEINPAMIDTPEVINQDPYSTGWVAKIEADDWETDRQRLMDPHAYYALIKTVANEELNQG